MHMKFNKKKIWYCDYLDLEKEELLPASRSLHDDDDDKQHYYKHCSYNLYYVETTRDMWIGQFW